MAIVIATSAVIAFFRGKPKVAEHIKKVRNIYLPSIVIGEFLSGTYRANDPESEIAKIEQFQEQTAITFNVDSDTAQKYAKIASGLAKVGTPISQNDMWIAALAIQRKLKLLTGDKHFRRIQGLEIILL